MKIKNIELCNWGRYQKASVPVDISNGKNLVLIRAINNTGKTSLFYAIRYAFYGEKGLKGHKQQNDPVDWINRQAAAKGDGQMYVELTIEHEGKDYRIQRTQKFYQTNTGQSIQPDGDEELQIFDQSKGGPSADAGKTNATRDNWISSTLISLDASQFFFFDGEDIQQYTDQPKEAVKKAILRVLGIKVLTNAKTDLENTQKTFNEIHSKKLKEKSKDNETKTKFTEVQDYIVEERTANEHLEKAVEQARRNKEGYTQQLRKNTAAQEKIKHRTQIEDSNKTYVNQLKENEVVLRDLRGVSSILLLDPLLKIIDGTEEVPASQDQWESQTAQQMLEKKLKNCLCGATIDDKIKKTLKGKILDLTSNPQSQLKRLVESAMGRGISDRKFVELDNAIKERVRLQGEIDTNDTAIKKINDELPGRGEDATIPVLRDKEKKCEDEIIDLSRAKERSNDRIDQLSKDEYLLKRKLEQGIDDAEVTLAEGQKDFVAKVRDAYQKCIDEFYKSRKPELQKFVSDVFMKLINNKKLYEGIVITDEWEMWVKYYDGTLLPTWSYGPSAGGAQIVATAFIAGLNKFARVDAPVVIDTPLARLDDIHRINILKYYNKMSEQVIILYTPAEINDANQAILEDNVNEHHEIISMEDVPDLSRIIPYEGSN